MKIINLRAKKEKKGRKKEKKNRITIEKINPMIAVFLKR